MDLYKLAKIILTIEAAGLSKVRFAKTIYFVHKELIRRGVSATQDLTYIRMPLGPVPEGFMELSQNHADIVLETRSTGLSYDANVYKLRKKPFRFTTKDEGYRTIESILEDLRGYSTSKLVEISHEEPSWIVLRNSARFNISQEDLKNSLPKRTRLVAFDQALENQSLQASLVNGMLKDIVDESTALEFPTNGR